MSTVEFFGETFTLNTSVSADAMTEFAQASSDASTNKLTMAAMVTVRDLVWDCIVPSELERFKTVSKQNRASVDDWMEILDATVAHETGRPTGRPSDSSDGPPVTEPKSVVSYDDRGLERLAGRPDLQLAVLHTRSA